MADLTEIVNSAWARLHESAELRGTGFRMAQLATIGANGTPRVRTVVLRSASQSKRCIRFYTDIRSPKVAELTGNGAVSLVAYHGEAGQQVRLEGAASLHHQDDVARTAWARTHPQSLVAYRSDFAPGVAMASAAAADPTDAMRANDVADVGFEHFCVVEVAVCRLDWLDLAPTGHRRAVFEWDAGTWRGNWVAP